MKRILVLLFMCCMISANEESYDEFFDVESNECHRAKIFSDETRRGEFTEMVGNDWQSRSFSVVKRIEKGKAIVTIIKDSAGPMYCVKQIRLDEKSKQIGHVRDVVASYVAESMNVRVNKVRIIPAEINFPGKFYPGRLATLHEFVPGSNKSHDFPFSIHLEQYLKSDVPARERGLTLRVINDMSKHDDLPPIVAYDTFISNPDRSGNNIFWDSSTRRFKGIDNELAFKLPMTRNLSEVAYYQIEKFFKQPGFNLSRNQYLALEQYNAVLQGLIEKNHPNDTCQLLQNVGMYAHVYFVNKSELIKSDHSLKKYCTKINAQYNSSKKLVKLIDTLLQSLRFHPQRNICYN